MGFSGFHIPSFYFFSFPQVDLRSSVLAYHLETVLKQRCFTPPPPIRTNVADVSHMPLSELVPAG